MMMGMSGSGGSGMGMMDMMGMGSSSGGAMNMSGMTGAGSMPGMNSMQGVNGMGYMPGMNDAGFMNGYGMVPGQGMYNGQGIYNGMNHGAAGGSNGLLGFGGFDSLLGGLLNLAIDIFAILLVVALVVGAAVLIKRYIFEGELLTAAKKTGCTRCGTALNADWACCPKCGEAKASVTYPVNPAPQAQ